MWDKRQLKGYAPAELRKLCQLMSNPDTGTTRLDATLDEHEQIV
jgi:hypothetical protein